MSNFHRDLQNDQLHHPKDFVAAANSTKLTKNATGNLEWIADSGGGGAVSQIVAGTGVTISPVGGTGNVTINAAGAGVSQIVAGTGITISPSGGTGNVTINSSGTANNFVSRNIKSFGSIVGGIEFGLGNAQYNNEHKFSTNLGAANLTSMSPKNMVNSSVWTNPISGASLKNWNGWAYGSSGTQVTISLLRVKLACPIEGEYPSEIPVCRSSAINLTMTGNNTPICFNVSAFSTCEGWDEFMQPNEVLVLSAYHLAKEEMTFHLNTNIMIGF